MATLYTTLGIDRLTSAERLQLLADIWDSFSPTGDDLPLSAAQTAEVARRLADHRANPAAVVPWEEVKARALRKIQTD